MSQQWMQLSFQYFRILQIIQLTYQPISKIQDNAELLLHDIGGKTVRLNFNRISENSIEADLTSVSNGVYQLQLITDNKYFIQKVVVIK